MRRACATVLPLLLCLSGTVEGQTWKYEAKAALGSSTGGVRGGREAQPAVTRDGKLFANWSTQGIELRRTAALLGAPRLRIQSIQGRGVYAMTFSPDGKRLFAGTLEGSVYCLRTDDGREVWRDTLSKGPVCSLDVSPDGKTVAAAGPLEVRVFATRDGAGFGKTITAGTGLMLPRERNAKLGRAVYFQTGKHLAVIEEQQVVVFTIAGGRLTGSGRKVKLPKGGFGLGGTASATGVYVSVMRHGIFHVEAKKSKAKKLIDDDRLALKRLVSNDEYLAGINGSQVQVWSIKGKKLKRVNVAARYGYEWLCMPAQGQVLYPATTAGTVHRVDLAFGDVRVGAFPSSFLTQGGRPGSITGRVGNTLRCEADGTITCIAARRIVIPPKPVKKKKKVRRRRSRRGRRRRYRPPPRQARPTVVETVELWSWNPATDELKQLRKHAGVTLAGMGPNHYLIRDKKTSALKLVARADGKTQPLPEFKNQRWLSVDGSGRYLKIKTYGRNEVSVYDLTSKSTIGTWFLSSDTRVVAAADGSWLVRAENSEVVAFKPDGAELWRFPKRVYSLAISPDGRYVLADDKLLDATTGRQLRTLQSPGFFSPDSKYALVGRKTHHDAALVDVASGKIRATFPGPKQRSAGRGYMTLIGCSSDAKRVLVYRGEERQTWLYERK